MSSQFNSERAIELVGRLCDDEISEDEVCELETMLRQHDEARRLYHLTVSLHRDLELCEIECEPQGVTAFYTDLWSRRTVFGSGNPAPTSQNRSRQNVNCSSHGSGPETWPAPPVAGTLPLARLAIAVCVLLAVSFFGLRHFRSEKSIVPTVATITDAVDVTWEGEQSAIGIGDGVPNGRIRMASGTICLTFHHGVVMTVESPADFELVDKEHVTLHDGRIVAYVPDGAEGFTVTTDAAKVVDLGTEFAVATTEDGSSEVTVFDGEVELAATKPIKSTPQRIVAGLAWRIDSDGRSHPEEFRSSDFESARTVIRQRRVIRETFRVERSFPGVAKSGWTSPWSVEADDLTVDHEATGIRSIEPLATGTKNYFTVTGTASSKAKSCQFRLSRGFDSFAAFNAKEPYTIELLLRLESDPAALERIRIFGVQPPLNAESDRANWQIATSRKKGETQPKWQLYRPQATRFNTLPLERNQTYRFLVEIHPQSQKWRASISDGTHSIWNTLKDGNPLRLKPDEHPERNLLGCELTIVPASDFRFSMDAIRIQNNPAATQESVD